MSIPFGFFGISRNPLTGNFSKLSLFQQRHCNVGCNCCGGVPFIGVVKIHIELNASRSYFRGHFYNSTVYLDRRTASAWDALRAGT